MDPEGAERVDAIAQAFSRVSKIRRVLSWMAALTARGAVRHE
jgi:hypothetical protein